MGGGTGDGAASYMKNPISGSALSYMLLPHGEDRMRWNCTPKLHLTRHLHHQRYQNIATADV